MKKNKIILFVLLLPAVIGLTACQYIPTILNDDDIVVHNSFTPPQSAVSSDPNAIIAGGVVAKTVEKAPDALCFKNISYATNESIANTYKTGGANQNEFNVNDNKDYYGSKSKNNFDLYVPKDLERNDKHTVVLFIHGGAWVSGFKTDVNEYLYEFTNRGYITATMKYTLLKKTMDDASLSIFRNLDEIDACIKTIKSTLEELGFNTSKTNLVLGGASSGAHLAMLYGYSRGHYSALPIKFLIDAVGPVSIKPSTWKRFKSDSETVLNAGLTKEAIQAQADADNLDSLYIADDSSTPSKWNDYQTMRIANGMCGIPYSLDDVSASSSNQIDIDHPNAASEAMTKYGGGEDQLSVTYYMNTVYKLPIICAYAGKDSVVGINQFAVLQETMDLFNITYELFYFKNSNHMDISKEKDETTYTAFINGINSWLEAL